MNGDRCSRALTGRLGTTLGSSAAAPARRAALALALSSALAVSIVLAGCSPQSQQVADTDTPQPPAGTATERRTDATPGGDAGSGGVPSRPGTSPPDDPRSSTPGQAEQPRGLEMPTRAPSTRLPEVDLPREGPLATRPWPAAGAVEGRLLDGFPGALRPTRSSAVLSSSLSPSADRLQVVLEATTALEPAAVLRTYRARLVPRGLVEEHSTSGPPGTETLTLRRGRTSATVLVSREDGATRYTLYAVVHAAEG